jgi:hypothetical protein
MSGKMRSHVERRRELMLARTTLDPAVAETRPRPDPAVAETRTMMEQMGMMRQLFHYRRAKQQVMPLVEVTLQLCH